MRALEEMTSLELAQVIARGTKTVVVPFGSVEHHGGHLPLGADALLADVVGRVVAGRLGAVLAPTVRVGCADAHMHGIGTLTVPAETLYDVAASTGRSLVAHGFRVIGLVSTHGGNRAALKRAAAAVQSLYRDVVVCAPEGDVGPDPGTRSGRWLTSVMLSLRPELVFAAAADTELILEVRSATAEEGTLNLERFAAAVVECVRKSAQEHGVVMA